MISIVFISVDQTTYSEINAAQYVFWWADAAQIYQTAHLDARSKTYYEKKYPTEMLKIP